jgi:glyoxylase-like metal-dependent hydrolase (beta-lactamase superfamily II)
MHPLDAPVYEIAVDSALRYGIRIEEPPVVDRELGEGDVLKVGSQELSVMHVPGHAPGHVAFYNESVIFGGDCLFAGSIGRTDLLYGDRETLDASVARLIALGDELTLYPGHGPATTIGRERQTNPFVIGTARLVRVKR